MLTVIFVLLVIATAICFFYYGKDIISISLLSATLFVLIMIGMFGSEIVDGEDIINQIDIIEQENELLEEGLQNPDETNGEKLYFTLVYNDNVEKIKELEKDKERIELYKWFLYFNMS